MGQDINLVLGGLSVPVSDPAAEILQDVTGDHVEQVLDGTVENPEATVTVTDQSVSGGRFLRTGSSRFLQSALVVTCRVDLSYTGSFDGEPSELVMQAFDGDNAAALQSLLRDSDAAFSDLASLAATLVGDDVDDDSEETGDPTTDSQNGGSPGRINPRRFLTQVGLPLN